MQTSLKYLNIEFFREKKINLDKTWVTKHDKLNISLNYTKKIRPATRAYF